MTYEEEIEPYEPPSACMLRGLDEGARQSRRRRHVMFAGAVLLWMATLILDAHDAVAVGAALLVLVTVPSEPRRRY